jgi:hypothetical protein
MKLTPTLRGMPVLLVGLALLALAARLVPGPRTIDDAYITFRYARNLLGGDGFVYNPGARVMGTTTPLYTLIMAGMGAAAGGTQADFPVLAWGFNAFADSLTTILLALLGAGLGARRAGIAAALLWAVAPYSVTFSIGGLETSLYILLLVGVAYFYLQRQLTMVGLLGALALLTRVDALLMAAPLALDWLIRTMRQREKTRWQAVAAFLAPVVLWYGFAWIYFGSPLPQSVSAKLIAYRLEPASALLRLLQHYATPFFEHNLLGAVGIGVGLFLYPFLALVGTRRAWKIAPRSLAWLVYPWIYIAVFALSNPLIFRWYLTPPLPMYFLAIFLGADALLSLVVDKLRLASVWQTAAVVLLLSIWPFVSSLSEWCLKPDHGAVRPAPDMAYIQLELLYRRAAEIVAPRMTADSTLAAGDVGVLGYYTPGRILDTVGLNSPETAAYYPLSPELYVINYAVAPDLILDFRPNLVVLLEVYGRKGLFIDESFLSGYRLVEMIDTDMYGSNGMLIYERVD